MDETYTVVKNARGGGFLVMRESALYADEPIFQQNKDGMTRRRNNKPVARVFGTEREAQEHANSLKIQNDRIRDAAPHVAQRLRQQRDRSRSEGHGR